jgi:hypothetical protein
MSTMVLAMRRALALLLALMLPATAVSGQDRDPRADASFHVTWQPQTLSVTRQIQGRVRNDSRFRVTNVRLNVEGLGADGEPVGRMFAWALGDINPGAETSFVAESMPGAVSYRIAIDSFDLVSEAP